MAITRAAIGTVGTLNPAGTTLLVPYPPTSSGQVMVLHVAATLSVDGPGGSWTEIYREATVTSARGGMWIKIADGTESGDLSVTLSSSIAKGIIVTYDGVDLTTPQDAAATNVSFDDTTDPTIDLPAITTVTDGAVAILGNASNSSSVTHTGPGTELVDYGADKSGALYELAPVTPPGSTGVQTITQSSGRTYWGAMLVLRPADTGAPDAVPLLSRRAPMRLMRGK